MITKREVPFNSQNKKVCGPFLVLLLSIYFANAIIVSLLCLWRGRVRLSEQSAQGLGKEAMTKERRLADELERLAVLHSRGILTDEEFQAAKRRILRGEMIGGEIINNRVKS